MSTPLTPTRQRCFRFCILRTYVAPVRHCLRAAHGELDGRTRPTSLHADIDGSAEPRGRPRHTIRMLLESDSRRLFRHGFSAIRASHPSCLRGRVLQRSCAGVRCGLHEDHACPAHPARCTYGHGHRSLRERFSAMCRDHVVAIRRSGGRTYCDDRHRPNSVATQEEPERRSRRCSRHRQVVAAGQVHATMAVSSD